MVVLLQTAQELQLKIKVILNEEWDPIGVSGVAGAQDEYDSYIRAVHKMLSKGCSRVELVDYLTWVEQDHMSLSPDRQLTCAIADKLLLLVKT